MQVNNSFSPKKEGRTGSTTFNYLRTSWHFSMSQFQKQTYSTMSTINTMSESSTRPALEGKTPVAFSFTFISAAIYVVSGVTQPMLISVAKDAGLADPSCQIYMLFYYFGPAAVILSVLQSHWPSRSTVLKAALIAVIDIFAQSMNYTGSSFAGPTIFAIIYSSVTIWTAVFSRIFLKRFMSGWQWLGVASVFAGLAITSFDAVSLGPQVFRGACMITLGSAVHAVTYVLSEAIMTKGEGLSVPQNCAVQGIVACTAFTIWQLVYTRRNFHELIQTPMQDAGTTVLLAVVILLSFSLANLVHALTFFHTLKHFPGGATSAGVMKGLQAVLVFAATSLAFCGRSGGNEMCFTQLKCLSLFVVVGGVCIFGKATEQQMQKGTIGNKIGYSKIEDVKRDSAEVV